MTWRSMHVEKTVFVLGRPNKIKNKSTMQDTWTVKDKIMIFIMATLQLIDEPGKICFQKFDAI
jgi:hypothetical protein